MFDWVKQYIVLDFAIFFVLLQRIAIERSHLWHQISPTGMRHPKDFSGEIQLFLNFPDLIVLIWREELRRISYSNPIDWQNCIFGKSALDMKNAIDAYC